jgi:hypothetical protein
MNRLVSVDPGARSGIALWSPEAGLASISTHHESGCSLIACRAVALPPGRRAQYLSIATKALEKYGLRLGDEVVVEGQWAIDRKSAAGRRARAASGRDVVALVERRCAWEYAGEIITGKPTEVIAPRDWMAIAKSCPGSTPGERIQWLISKAFQIQTGLDEAAAIGLGLWWLRKNPQLVKR